MGTNVFMIQWGTMHRWVTAHQVRPFPSVRRFPTTVSGVWSGSCLPGFDSGFFVLSDTPSTYGFTAYVGGPPSARTVYWIAVGNYSFGECNAANWNPDFLLWQEPASPCHRHCAGDGRGRESADLIDIVNAPYLPGSLGIWKASEGLATSPNFTAPDYNQSVTITGDVLYMVQNQFFQITISSPPME